MENKEGTTRRFLDTYWYRPPNSQSEVAWKEQVVKCVERWSHRKVKVIHIIIGNQTRWLKTAVQPPEKIGLGHSKRWTTLRYPIVSVIDDLCTYGDFHSKILLLLSCTCVSGSEVIVISAIVMKGRLKWLLALTLKGYKIQHPYSRILLIQGNRGV